MTKWMRWVGACVVLALAGCGGGGDAGGGSGPGFGDPRNGTYLAYAANGRIYDFTVNFDSGTYRMAGNGIDAQGSFTAGGGSYIIGGNARFRTATDLVAGGFNFGSGVTSFIAARQFVTSAAGLTPYTFNEFGINLGTPHTAGGASSRFASGSTLQTCTDATIYTIAACPAGSVYTYALTFNGSDITGVDAGHANATIRFRVARSGSTLVYLRAETPSGGVPAFRIGLPEAAGLAGGTFIGASNVGNWATTTLTAGSYDIAGLRANGANFNDGAVLSALNADQPAGIRSGVRSSDGVSLLVMQGGPLSVVVGAGGYLEIGLQ
ncbi:hypothetical protein [Piscinibacter sp. HJYY11]|uniref:hypothetical protein n=1 Tax=Piscinibacter sp. HJYY11 TaxID=2801333 RepID=UPI0019201CF5|nr:hypothetical protein [Piscinibacter sp. HJYY11]MBL0730053.1 hypothetical protein [Piscinibacter sp. HJYY11]